MSSLNRDSLWPRVQEHLDARRDPLDDPDVQRFLLDNPQHLEEFAELKHGLGALQPVTGGRRRRKVPWAAAVMLLSALGLLWTLQPGDEELPAPGVARGGRVFLLDITTVIENHETRTVKRVDRGNYVHRAVETITYLNTGHLTSLEIQRTRRYSE